jgi:hypothetical protein
MADPVLTLATEYFHMGGFAVSPLPAVPGRSHKKPSETHGFLAINRQPRASDRPGQFQLFAADLAAVERALVVCHPGNNLVLPALTRKNPARMVEFIKKELAPDLNHTLAEWMEAGHWTEGTRRLAVVPVFPGTEPELSKASALLRQNGADGVISLTTVLEHVLKKVDVGDTTLSSEALQLVRLLKLFDWIKSPQLELFSDDRFQSKR